MQQSQCKRFIGGEDLRSERPRLSGNLRGAGRQEKEKREKVEGVKRKSEKKGVKGKRRCKENELCLMGTFKGRTCYTANAEKRPGNLFWRQRQAVGAETNIGFF